MEIHVFKRRTKSLEVPTTDVAPMPNDEPMRLYIQHQFMAAGYTTSRFYFTPELVPTDNTVILNGLDDVVELFPDTDFRPGVRFYRHHVSISWYPSSEEGLYELAFLESTMGQLLAEIFVMEVVATVLYYDKSDPLTGIHSVVDLSLRLGVDWGPTSHQRVIPP